jgi:hypothetical protein
MGAGASIILNGSMAATIGTGESSAYAASKAGVRAMCRSLAGELSRAVSGSTPSFPALSKRQSGGERRCLPKSLRRSRDPERVSLGYNPSSRWRNRSEFFAGREQIVAFPRRKWARELDYRRIKELWAFKTIASPPASPMNSMTIWATGFAPVAMRTGSSTRTAWQRRVMRRSAICAYARKTANIIGRWTPTRRSSGSEQLRILKTLPSTPNFESM